MKTMNVEQMENTNGGTTNGQLYCGGTMLLAMAACAIPVAGAFIGLGLMGHHFAKCVF